MRISGDYKNKGLARRKQRKYSIKGIELIYLIHIWQFLPL